MARKINRTPKHSFAYNQMPNNGFTFALVEDGQVMHTAPMCKDYLSDIFWTERTGGWSDIYGLKWKKGMLDINRKSFQMLLHGGTAHLDVRAEALEAFLNAIEKAQGFSPTLVEKTDAPTDVLLTFSEEWTMSPALISAYTSAIRIAGAFKKGDDPVDYLNSLKAPTSEIPGFISYMTPDVSRIKWVRPRLKAMLKGMKVEQDLKSITSCGMAHGGGIVGFVGFPMVEKEI